ncbi:acetylglutamate kinase [Algivirga pacifica]|uniref:Acetylglutamate kinase n=1 Tax=Algivirga pacifica TaxID=1162670 RepID=A0ABP9DA30_9BACT
MKLSVVKVGGNIIDNQEALHAFLKQFNALEGPKLLVHGGGKIASELGKEMGITPNMVNGRRVTDKATLDLVTMVYGGLINKNLVAVLQAMGCNAIGLTGADGNTIQSVKRPVKEVDYGFVGDVQGVNAYLLQMYLKEGFVPVFAPLTHDLEGNMLNTNADTVATEVAKALAEVGYEVSLKYCFDKPGVMLDLQDADSLVKELTPVNYATLKEEGVIAEGMLPKLHNAFQAVEAGVEEVVLGLAEGILQQQPFGTVVKAEDKLAATS